MRLRDFAIGAVITALFAGGVALTIPSPAPLAPPPTAALPVKLSTPSTAPAPVVAAPPLATAPPVSTWRELHVKYANAQNLRAFFYEILRKPDQSAMYYAISVLYSCKLAIGDASNALSGARQAAAAALRQRCDFSAVELEDAQRALSSLRELGPRDDVLSNSMFDYAGADGSKGREKVLLAALEQGNPEIIAVLTATAVERAMLEETPAAQAQALSLPVGSLLVACGLGADCGPGSVRTLELCMEKGWCADSIPAALQQGLGEHYAAAERAAARVLDDIRCRDARRLAVLRNG